MVDVLNQELGRIIEIRVPNVTVRRRSGDEPWFDELCCAVFRRMQAAYHRYRCFRTPASWILF